MRLETPGKPHLSYCTNIHAGVTLDDVRRIVREHVPEVKRRLGVQGAFGVGLRLAAAAAHELARPDALAAFRDLLAEHDLYVFTLNGFPHGTFHGTRVKESVYLPDWLEDERVRYTDELAGVLAELLPPAVDGSISTVPGAIRARGAGHEERIAERILRHAARLHAIREATGRLVELSLEPEPGCLLETTTDTVRFFEDHLFSADAVRSFAGTVGGSPADAEAFLRRHVGMCLDACHLAVEFEEPAAALQALRGAGIRIGKVQVTVALAAKLSGDARADERTLEALERFADPVYLHQVVARSGTTTDRFLDLPEAIAWARGGGARGASEWRVHFHVPVYTDAMAPFASTQPFLKGLLAEMRRTPVSEHLEVETYTWDVLPEEHRAGGVDAGIARELAFTLEELGAPTSRSSGSPP